MTNNGFADEYAQMAATQRLDTELYQQAHDEYEAQLARVPLRVDYASDGDYEDALAAWDEITQTLLDRAKELERAS